MTALLLVKNFQSRRMADVREHCHEKEAVVSASLEVQSISENNFDYRLGWRRWFSKWDIKGRRARLLAGSHSGTGTAWIRCRVEKVSYVFERMPKAHLSSSRMPFAVTGRHPEFLTPSLPNVCFSACEWAGGGQAMPRGAHRWCALCSDWRVSATGH